MLYLLGFSLALQLALGQAFWKIAVEKADFALTAEFIFSRKLLGFISSPALILGILFYLSATIINMWMLTKYELNAIQLVAIPLTLIFVILVGWKVFGENLQPINVFGLAILIMGVWLATIKT